ncbi:MAG TPA: helix-hairpin-helix domain-containing protein [Gemmatimonadales bacterium]|nr:helix-hairpin-helix domain-containing protein [Gemmatimonadales bacterium]
MTKPARRRRAPASDALQASRKDLQTLSGVGPSIADDLISLGIRRREQLRGKDAIALYRRLCRKTGTRQDPCVLDVFACAIWHAENPDARQRKWWLWSRARLKD